MAIPESVVVVTGAKVVVVVGAKVVVVGATVVVVVVVGAAPSPQTFIPLKVSSST